MFTAISGTTDVLSSLEGTSIIPNESTSTIAKLSPIAEATSCRTPIVFVSPITNRDSVHSIRCRASTLRKFALMVTITAPNWAIANQTTGYSILLESITPTRSPSFTEDSLKNEHQRSTSALNSLYVIESPFRGKIKATLSGSRLTALSSN